jgi:hypothetical protein
MFRNSKKRRLRFCKNRRPTVATVALQKFKVLLSGLLSRNGKIKVEKTVIIPPFIGVKLCLPG